MVVTAKQDYRNDKDFCSITRYNARYIVIAISLDLCEISCYSLKKIFDISVNILKIFNICVKPRASEHCVIAKRIEIFNM